MEHDTAEHNTPAGINTPEITVTVAYRNRDYSEINIRVSHPLSCIDTYWTYVHGNREGRPNKMDVSVCQDGLELNDIITGAISFDSGILCRMREKATDTVDDLRGEYLRRREQDEAEAESREAEDRSQRIWESAERDLQAAQYRRGA